MKLLYRPEIDGLRAIAVLSVIIYHAQFSIFEKKFFSGGFFGVDIFFVISGYLISLLILKELYATGNFSFSYFYERRIRRIFPVLFLVVIVSLPFAWNYLIPSAFVEFSKSILFLTIFSSNFFFYKTNVAYGAENSLLKPFLHTWSLSVEEQFYLIFPIIFFFFFKFLRRYIFFLITFLLLFSFFFTNFIAYNDKLLSFYILPARAWELLSGSLLAYLEIKNFKNFNKKNKHQFIACFGFCLIIFPIFFFDEQFKFPIIFTLTTIICLSLVIWYSSYNNIIKKILSYKIFVFIGLISYSLYLWHYPIFAFGRFSETNINNNDKFFWILLTFILSIFSYFLVERPARKKNTKFKKILISLSIIILVSVIFSNIVINKNGVYSREFIKKNLGLKFDNYILDKNYYVENHFLHFNINFKPNNFHFDNGKKNILIVGNSFALDFIKIINSNKKISDKYNFDLLSPNNRTKETGYQVYCLEDLITKKDTKCNFEKKVFDSTKNIIEQYEKSNIIFLTSQWTDKDIKSLDKIIPIIKNHNKEVIIANQSILIKLHTSYALNSLDYFVMENGRLPNKIETNSLEKLLYSQLINDNYFLERRNTNKKLKSIAEKYSVKFFNHELYQCDFKENKCYLFTDDYFKIYFDYGHNTYEGAEFLGKKILEKKLLNF